MTNGIILAGGKGSRLGPLSAQLSKALVSIGQRPHVFHQIELLRAAGCDWITIVVSPGSQQQITDVIQRAGVQRVNVIVQEEPWGPVDALGIALTSWYVDASSDTYMLFSDTYLTEPLDRGLHTWIGEASAPTARSFCTWDSDVRRYVDRVVGSGTPVTIGAYHFADTKLTRDVVVALMRNYGTTEEVGMGPFLSCIQGDALPEQFMSWLDIGDVAALGSARRTRFIARAHHSLTLDDAGLITKRGEGDAFDTQMEWLLDQRSLPPRSANLIPELYSTTSKSYTSEYIDLPTLAELWLYWPGLPETWATILESIIQRLKRDLWWSIRSIGDVTAEDECELFVGKALRRLGEWDQTKLREALPLLSKATHYFKGAAKVRAHGDLNFNNILYSVNTGMIKLLDPRGDTFLPITYELAKLRYSYHAGFAAITHGLTSPDRGLLPQRLHEIAALDEVIARFMPLDKCTIAEACLLLAGAPLHNEREANAMFNRGKKLLEGLVA